MKHTNKSQAHKIYLHIVKRKKITPLEALNKYGCFRLAARIHELRKEGANIKKRKVVRNKKQFAEYYI